jgi:hypothetical protein
MENKKKKISFVQKCADLKRQLEKEGYDFEEHVLFGLDVDQDAQANSIISSFKAGGYTALGLLTGIIKMAEVAQKEVEDGFVNIITEGNERSKKAEELDNDGIGIESLGKADPEIMKIIASRKYDLLEALRNKDDKRLDEIQAEIIDEIKKVKGEDFDAILRMGIPPEDEFKVKDEEKNIFNKDNIKKFF